MNSMIVNNVTEGQKNIKGQRTFELLVKITNIDEFERVTKGVTKGLTMKNEHYKKYLRQKGYGEVKLEDLQTFFATDVDSFFKLVKMMYLEDFSNDVLLNLQNKLVRLSKISGLTNENIIKEFYSKTKENEGMSLNYVINKCYNALLV